MRAAARAPVHSHKSARKGQSMSFFRILTAVFAALMFFVVAPPADAKSVPAAAVNDCMYAWASAFARENGTTVEGALRYARRIKTVPPTTLTIHGAPFSFTEATRGSTVWSVCEQRLERAQAAAERTTPPAASMRSLQEHVRALESRVSALETENAAADRGRAALHQPGPRFLFALGAGFLIGLVVTWALFRLYHRPRRRSRRKLIHIGPHGPHEPRRPPDEHPDFDDPTDSAGYDFRTGPR